MFLISHWAAPPGVLVPVLLTAAVHARGLRRTTAGHSSAGRRSPGPPSARRRQRGREALLFYSGLATVLLALVSPIDYWSGVDFWPHMLQHLILIFIAAPLIVLGAPWLPMLRGLPARPRRKLLRLVYTTPAGGRVRAALHALGHPVVAVAAFLTVFLVWHLTVMYDLTLANPYVHDLEHVCFLVIGVWLWSQLVGSYPYSPRWGPLPRVWLIAAVLFGNWMLAIALTFARTPWYPAYARVTVPHMPLLADQSLAGAMMWVLPMIPLGITAFTCLNVWLDADADDDDHLQAMIDRTRATMSVAGGD